MSVKMIAIKDLTYGTRRVKKGSGFDANPRDARTLMAIGKAEYATRAMTAAKPGAVPPAEPVAMDDIAAVRAEYERVLGKRPFMGWDVATLRTKIAEVRS